jgi:hypothetical protein
MMQIPSHLHLTPFLHRFLHQNADSWPVMQIRPFQSFLHHKHMNLLAEMANAD